MSYVHRNKSPVALKNDYADPDDIDWIYFVYGGYLSNGVIVDKWLRDGETIISHSALVTGGAIETDSTYLGTLTDSNGVECYEVYGVQYSVNSGVGSIKITHRKSTTTTGDVDLGRLNIDHSGTIPVIDR